MRKRRYNIMGIILIMVVLMTIPITATEVDGGEEAENVEQEKTAEEETMEEKIRKAVEKATNMGDEEIETEYLRMTDAGLMYGDVMKYGYDSAAYEGFIAELRKSIELDAREGLEGLKDVTPTKDSIEMLYWGPFLEKYIGKTISEYPSEDIAIVLQNRTIQIKTDKRSKEWLYSTIMPILVETLVNVSDEYPVVKYRLEIKSGTPLTDLNLDKENLNIVEGQPVYPLAGGLGGEEEPQIVIYNTGVSYGFMLDAEYLKILKGYHNESPDKYRVEGRAYPGSVDILAYITTPRNLGNLNIDELTIRDFGIYEDLAINLITKELVNHKNLSNTGREETYKDFRLKEEDLIVVPIKDTVVIVQPKFYEGTRVGKYDFLTLAEVDFTGILTQESDKVMINKKAQSIDIYRSKEGMLEIFNGNASPFIVYARPEHIPYERVIKWAYGPDYDLRYNKEQRDELMGQVKDRMYAAGLKSEYKVYTTKVGQGGTNTLKKVIPVTLLIVGILGVVLYKRKKNQNRDVDDLLFGDEDDEDDFYE